MIRVKVYKDGQSLTKHDLSGDDLIIGREKSADVHLPSQAVSRRHARLQKSDEGWQVADMGAANGVYVSRGGGDPERVVIQKVEPGDVIIIETFSIKFEEIEGGEAAASDKDEAFDENSLETKRTQFISMVDVLDATDGTLHAPSSGEGGPEASGPHARPAVSKDTWWARMESAQGHSRTFQIDKPKTMVGKGPGCDVVLPTGPDEIVELERSGPSVSLTRTSKWPFPRVTVDGQAVKSAVLSHGDSFCVGDYEVHIHLDEAP